MHIDGWFVDGFGVFHDYEQRGLGDRLTVFVGANEAGKSTLLAFLRWVLVGHPSRGASDHYRPLNGGRHGGRVFIRGLEGEISVERMVGPRVPRVVFPDRAEEGDEAVRRLLGGVDAGLFNSVFAFSLSELQDLESLTGEGVRDRIFSAGIAGAGRSARQAIARLEKEAAELVRPRKGGRVNDLLSRLETVERKVAEARTAAIAYPALVEAELAAAATVRSLSEHEDARRAEERRYRVLEQLWPLHQELSEILGRLDRLEPVDRFPAEPEERLATVLSKAAAATGRISELEAEVNTKSVEIKGAQTSLREDLPGISARLEGLVARLSLYEDRVASLPEARGAFGTAKEALSRSLAVLGPAWDQERVRGFDTSLPRHEELRMWASKLEGALLAVRERERAYEPAAERARQAEVERDRLRSRLEGLEPTPGEEIRSQEAALRRLRADVQELRQLETKIDNLRALAQDREQALRMAVAMAGAGVGGGLGTLLGALAAAGLVAAAALGWVAGPGWAVGVGAAAAALAAAAYLTARSRRSLGAVVHGEERGLREAAESAARALAAAAEQAEVLRARVEKDAAFLGLGPRPTFSDIEDREVPLTDARERLLAREELEARLADAEEAFRQAAAQREHETSNLREASEAEGELHEEWMRWKTRAGFDRTLGPDGVTEFLRAIREAQQALRAQEETAGRLRRLQEELELWEDQAHDLLVELGLESGLVEGSGDVLPRRIRELARLCVEDQATRDRLGRLEEELRALEAKLRAAREGADRVERERAALLAEAGVADEADFREKLSVFRLRRELESRAAELRRDLDSRVGRGPEAEELRAELATGRMEHWSREAEGARRELEHATSDREAAIRQHRDAERNRQALEESSDVAAREMELGAVRAELEQALSRWRVVSAARSLIEETLAEYSRTRQPPVLAEASAGFCRVTGGAYQRILEREDSEGFVVLDDCGGVKLPEQLSRGTLEQLYLSLRLGLAREFARRTTSVPVIMDDVLVNFDPARAQATADLLTAFAAEQQVLFFTCHPATVDLLLSADPGVRVVPLGRATMR
ncbi:MAG: AAA family ATPase [Thermoleophilia bacterium]|nr:AAA family ATPase [Thermoleophilia bacterium]